MADSPREEIAIVGMAGRFPGARDIAEFWRNLRDGVESVASFTTEELAGSGVDPAVLQQPGYVNASAVLEEADAFDSAFFGMLPREAELTDPQHRIFLECAWTALEHAGCDPERYEGLIGVYGGVARNTYLLNNLATRRDLLDAAGAHQSLIATDKDFSPTRVSYKLNLRGPSINVQTACSTSGVAIHLACQALFAGDCDMALAGGARVRVPLKSGYMYEEGGIQSPDGHCRAFDAAARGTVLGSGVAILVLKRLSDALRDGDTIHALIKGTAINNDGSAKIGFTAPSIDGQARVISEALAVAEISADSISYVEAHGTGTSLGDPIEIAALTKSFRQTSQKTGSCPIGSVKTNIGHLDAGAGAAGVIKTVLALQHRQLPPSLNFQQPNPQIDFANSPFYVNAKLADWRSEGEPRRAGVSSFGIGGTNSHVILEEAPEAAPSSGSRVSQLLVLSAKTAVALDTATANLARHLHENPGASLADISHTLQIGRQPFAHRRIVVASSAADAAEALEKRNPRRVFTAAAPAQPPQIAFMFPGQGAQFPGMARELFDTEPVFREALLQCAKILGAELDLISAIHPAEGAADTLTQTALAQPAIFAVEYALAQLWKSWGIEPQAMLGHSVGEYVAACLAGVFSLEEGLRLLAARAQLMQELPGGAMLAVRLGEEDLRPHLSGAIELAAINSPRLCVVSGACEAIAAFEEKMQERGVACVRLQTSHAFHSAMMQPIIESFTELAAKLPMRAPQTPLFSTVTGSREADFTRAEYWARQMREPVRFSAAAHAAGQDYLLLELGPGSTLAALARQSGAASVVASLSTTRDHDQAAMLEALGRLWLAGVAVDWSRLRHGEQRRRVPLPTYPFERQRYWIDAAKSHTPQPQLSGPAEAGAPTISEVPVAEAAESTPALTRLRELLHEMSGLPVERLTGSASLLELGFDSLFLTQVALALQKSFGVKIAFRQLFEELSTIEALAAWISARATPQLPQVQPSAAVSTASSNGNSGPFRPIPQESSAHLTAQQLQHLDALIARYEARTRGSKNYAQQHRAHFADPRAVSGFRKEWKEIVYPLVAQRSEGARLWDIDGNEYVDFTMGFGTNLLGHSPKFITDAVKAQLDRGVEIGPQSAAAGEAARLLCDFSGMQRATFCNTGSEAVLAAIRVARTVTGRTKIATFNGYHGINDEVLVRGKWIGAERRTVPIAPGIPEHVAREVLALDYGAPESLDLLRAEAHNLAAVLVEPVQSRNLDLQPREFLHAVREITRETGAMLVFDELITGFRCHPGGAQAWFGVQADLATYGKILGGGMPIGALAGRADCLDALDGGEWNFGDDSQPEAGMTFFAGTYVRHPLAMAGALATLRHLAEEGPELQERLNARAAAAAAELQQFVAEIGAPMRIETFSSMFHVKFASDFAFGPLLFFHLREQGIHAWDNRLFFFSTAHSDADIQRLIEAFKGSVRELRDGGFFSSSAPARLAITSSAVEFAPTDAQQELILADRMGGDASASFNDSITIHLRGPLNEQALRTAARRMVQRHEALRTVFAADGATQRVLPEPNAAIELADLSTLDAAAQREAISERVARAAETPFDLAGGPLLRLQLLKLSHQQHDLIFTVHHIVCDGWSFGVVARDLARFYSAAAAGTEPQPVAPTQFREYCGWLREQQRRPEFQETERYWLDQFSTVPPPLDLPVDHARGSTRTYRGARCAAEVEPALLDELRRFSAAHRCTLFTTMLAAFQTLLHRLTGQDDLVVGIAASGQSAMGADELVGHCVNFLPIRARLAADADFLAFLAEQRRLVLDAFEHQNYTFGTLLQKLALPRDASRMPLLGATFNVDRSTTNLEFSGLEAEFELNPKERLGLELSLNVIETEHGTRLYCSYNRDLFEPETIARWLQHYRTLLQSILAAPETPLARLPILTEPERRQLTVEWNATDRPYPSEQPVHAIFQEWAERTPQQLAIADGESRVTYAELNGLANRFTRDLLAGGVQPGDRVGLPAQRSISFVAAAIGILKAGGVYVPLNPDEPAERSAAMERDCRLLVDLEREPQSRDAGNVQVSAPPDSAAYVLYTSGSTGAPKGVVAPHRGIARLVCNTDYVQLTPGDVIALASNLCFDAVTFEIWGALLNGASLAITPTELLLSPARLEEHFTRHGVTTLFITTALFNQIAQQRPQLFSRLRTLIFGGEVADVRSVRRVLELGRPQRLLNAYGPTETTTFATMHVLESAPEKRVPIGRPIANTRTYILDAQLQPVPIGVAGELFIGGPGVALGYLHAPELTAGKFLETEFGRLYRSGDLARWLPGGEIDYLARADQQIKLRGFRIEPGEIEAALGRIGGIGECTVVAREFGPNDRRIVAYYTQNGAPPPQPEALARELGSMLPAYMVPAAFVEMPKLPVTPNGKIDVQALPLPDVQRSSEPVAPRTELEASILSIWKRLLRREEVGVEDSFFDLGGHSLLALQMFLDLERELGASLPAGSLLREPTVAALARMVKEQPRPEAASLAVAIKPGGKDLPLFFVHAGDGGILFYRELANRLDANRPVYGLEAPWLTGREAAADSVEEIAAGYLAHVRLVQPRGPYHIGGFSFGGVVGFEMAQQLVAQGERVELLALLDTGNPQQRPQRLRLAERVKRNLHRMRGLSLAERAKLIGSRGMGLYAVNLLVRQEKQKIATARMLKSMNQQLPAELHALAGRSSHIEAMRKYVPKRFPGRMLLFVATDRSDGFSYSEELGWEGLVEELTICRVEGAHDTIVQEPHVEAVAAELSRWLGGKGEAVQSSAIQ